MIGCFCVYSVYKMSFLHKFIGNIGEKYAEKHLKTCGYTILKRQYNAKFTEIDLLAEKDNALCIFEVKSVSYENTSLTDLSHSGFHPVNRIGERKLQKMSDFADYYLNIHPEYSGVEIGIITVILSENKKNPEIEIFFI